MSVFRRSGGQVTLAVLGFISVGISIYLTYVHYNSNVPLVCSTNGFVNCENVLTSSYSFVPGTTLPVSLPGILWSVVALALPLAVLKFGPQAHLLRIGELVWGVFGILAVFYFVYTEIVLIYNLCVWCTSVHIIVLVYLLISVVLLQDPVADEEGVYEDEEELSNVPVR